MCDPATMAASLTALQGAFGGAAAATAAGGATAAAAASTGTTLATYATYLTAIGSVVQGVSAYNAGKKNARLMEQQAKDNANLKTQEDERMRMRMRKEMARQNLQLAGRGISPDSPTVIALGKAAQDEMAYASGAIQSDAAATTAELTASARASRAKGTTALLGGGLDAAAGILNRKAKNWAALQGTG